MRVADYIFKTLADWGVRHVFFLSGGGAMYLNDALGLEKRIRYVCNLHEQACAIAAEGYARVTNQPGIVCVTTGPGGTNAVTGVMGAWVDSIPMVIISGQVKQETVIGSCPGIQLRQLGDQEINIVDIVRPITKYAVMVRSKADIRYHLEKAWSLAITGRPGPVWLDIPLDVQAAEITDPERMKGYVREECKAAPQKLLQKSAKEVLRRIQRAERPVIIAGHGVRAGDATGLFRKVVDRLNVPVLTTISGVDLVASSHPLFFGRPGILGERAANFVVQNSDLVLILGTRMNIRILGYAYEKFARAAYKIMVDIDSDEMKKPTLSIDLPIHACAGDFLTVLNNNLKAPLHKKKPWLDYCRSMRKAYPVVLEEHRKRTDYVSSYAFSEILSDSLKGDEIIVTGNGVAYTSTFQAFHVKARQRMFANVACAAMGYDLPAAIGAAFAGRGKEVVCITGDGSVQMNIQELQTIVNYSLPIKLFVFNNAGYLSIKHTQNGFFNGRFVGSEATSGVILPDLSKIAKAYGLPYIKAANNREFKRVLPKILAASGPVVCELILDPFEVVGPKSATTRLADGRLVSRPLEDLAPFLPRDEFMRNMIVPVCPECL
jgi:acetolactate synthase I/II/III large subunit